MVPDIEVPGVGLTVQPSVAGGTAINDVIGDWVTVQPSVSGGAAWQVAEAVGTGVTVKPSITLGSVSASVAGPRLGCIFSSYAAAYTAELPLASGTSLYPVFCKQSIEPRKE